MAIVAKLGWKIVGGVTGSLTTAVTQKALNAAWGAVRKGEPPLNPEHKGVSWPEAISWALASAAGMAVTRVVSQRLAAGAWEKATGTVPPGFEDLTELSA